MSFIGTSVRTVARAVAIMLTVLPMGTPDSAPMARQQPLKSPESHQFDFWLGAWSVNLRVKQADGTWKDQIQATEYSYPILGGKALLELWNETSREDGRKGYSVRYYRDDIDQWELWLNWPAKNQAGSSVLRGAFRHNRGEFFYETKQADSTTLTARYTFSDITPTTFRWDDAYSTDHGETWRNRWIMEFTRQGAAAPPLPVKSPANSYGSGTLCDLPPFREFEQLSGTMHGTMRYRASTAAEWKTSPATYVTHKIVGGCATISFLEFVRDGVPYQRFIQNSYNTSLQKFEAGLLDNVPGTTYRTLLGRKAEQSIDLEGMNVETNAPTDERSLWTIDGNGLRLTDYRKLDGEWIAVGEGSFTR